MGRLDGSSRHRERTSERYVTEGFYDGTIFTTRHPGFMVGRLCGRHEARKQTAIDLSWCIVKAVENDEMLLIIIIIYHNAIDISTIQFTFI